MMLRRIISGGENYEDYDMDSDSDTGSVLEGCTRPSQPMAAGGVAGGPAIQKRRWFRLPAWSSHKSFKTDMSECESDIESSPMTGDEQVMLYLAKETSEATYQQEQTRLEHGYDTAMQNAINLSLVKHKAIQNCELRRQQSEHDQFRKMEATGHRKVHCRQNSFVEMDQDLRSSTCHPNLACDSTEALDGESPDQQQQVDEGRIMAKQILSVAMHHVRVHNQHQKLTDVDHSQMAWQLAGEWMTDASEHIQQQHQQQHIPSTVNSDQAWRCAVCRIVNRAKAQACIACHKAH